MYRIGILERVGDRWVAKSVQGRIGGARMSSDCGF